MIMFKVLKNNKQSVRKVFFSYEEARSYVRKLIRKNDPNWFSINPPISMYGYSIKQI